MYIMIIYTYTVFVCVCKCKKNLCQDQKSALYLHNALFNIAQNMLHVYTFLNMCCFQPQQFTIDNMWMQYGVAHVLAG